MHETAYNTINERIDQVTNANRNVAAQFQPPKINFINNTPVRKPDGRTHAAVISKLKGHTKNAVYQLRHKLGKGVCDPINKYIDPKNPDQTALDLPPGKKPSLNKHHHESVGELLLPIYTMHNGGMNPVDIAKSINQSVELVQAAIAMKKLYKPAQ